MLPHDLPPWCLVFNYFRTWRKDGTWQRANGALHVALRPAEGRQSSPSAAIIDSQSVKTTEKETRGYDAGQKVKARKGHLVVDTLGLPLAVVVHPADIPDRDGAKLALGLLLGRFPRLQLIWVDGAYGGKLVEWAKTAGGWTLELVRRPANQHTFQALPRRRVVERTFGWLNL